MCGICGFLDLGQRTPQPDLVLRQMTGALVHRGPDEEGYQMGEGLFLGHRRLRIIDLVGGHQPMTNRDGRISLVFNGEIYNFKEIRRDLETKGRYFVSNCDTESLLQFYEEKGIECLRQLEGMFAFAIYDRRERVLHLAVDRFGKKPLYYVQQEGLFIFASEIKSLLKHPLVPKSIDLEALRQYLAFEYVPAPRSIFKGIQKLESGMYLELREGQVKKCCYCKRNPGVLHRAEEEWKEELLRFLKEAVRKRLVSDVPLGIFLSGGIDSSSIAAMVRQLEPGRKIKTFTIGFDDVSFDESIYAQKISDYFATDHIRLRCTLQQMLKEHQDILSHLDEPLADASFIPTFILCRLARQHVTVALSGDGGDELFEGYPTFLANRLVRKLDSLPRAFLKVAQAVANGLPVSLDNFSFDFKLKQFLKGIFYPDLVRDQVWLGSFTDVEQESLLLPSVCQLTQGPYEIIHTVSYLQEFYFRFYLQGDILVKIDRASMANSLEVRSPILDDCLVQKMWQLDPSLRVRGRQLKYIFKKTMEGLLPQEMIYRQKKGFGIPIGKWIQQDLRKDFESTLSQKELEKDQLFQPQRVQRILQEHLSGKKDNRKQLWTLYVFQKWKRRWLG